MNKKNYGETIISFASTLQTLLMIIGIIGGIAVAVFVGEIADTGIGFLCFAVVAGFNILLAWVLSLFMKGFGQLISDTCALKNHFVGDVIPTVAEIKASKVALHDEDSCPYCGNAFSPKDSICNRCGAWKCRGCGRWNSNTVGRCAECDWAK